MTRSTRLVIAILGFVSLVLLGLMPALVRLWPELSLLRWDRPWFFVALVLAPVALVYGTLGEDARVPRLLIGSIAVARAVPLGLRARLRDAPGIFRAAAITLGVIAIARPQSIVNEETDERRGIDIMLVVDLSGSMRAADLKPTRIAAAKAVVQEFIERRNDDRLGAVVFAKEAFLVMPPTFDRQRLGQKIGKLNVGVISGDGTAIGEGLGFALAKLRQSSAKSKVIVLLTDGDNNAGEMSPERAMAHAKELGVKIFAIQMGNGDEVDIEIDQDAYGRPIYGRVKFPVKPELLKKIADETGGEMFIATETEQLRSSMHQVLDRLEKTRFEAASGNVVERFVWALTPAVILVLIEALLRALVLKRFP